LFSGVEQPDVLMYNFLGMLETRGIIPKEGLLYYERYYRKNPYSALPAAEFGV
jgi:hypothetical protein